MAVGGGVVFFYLRSYPDETHPMYVDVVVVVDPRTIFTFKDPGLGLDHLVLETLPPDRNT